LRRDIADPANPIAPRAKSHAPSKALDPDATVQPELPWSELPLEDFALLALLAEEWPPPSLLEGAASFTPASFEAGPASPTWQ